MKSDPNVPECPKELIPWSQEWGSGWCWTHVMRKRARVSRAETALERPRSGQDRRTPRGYKLLEGSSHSGDCMGSGRRRVLGSP